MNTPPKINLLVSNTSGLKGSSEQLVVCYFTESSSCSQLVFPPVTIDYNGEVESVKKENKVSKCDKTSIETSQSTPAA